MRVVVCKGDLLEDVFGVQQLTISNYKCVVRFFFHVLDFYQDVFIGILVTAIYLCIRLLFRTNYNQKSPV